MQDLELREILKDKFGHADFRFDQLDIIKTVLSGEDALAIMPTGGGKSVCYQVPALYMSGVTLVISPLISLMHDQVMNLQLNGVNSCYLNSTQDPHQKREAQGLIESGAVKIVYVSPEGLLSGGLSNFFRRIKVSLIAIDEAHCVSQWGHEFRADYMRLGELRDVFPGTPVLALTATADKKTREDIILQLRMASQKTFISSFDRPNIKYQVSERINEIKQVLDFINENHPNDTGIIYCLSRRKVEKTTFELQERGVPARAYHAGLSADERTDVQEAFNREERIIVVATVAFGMGIDRPDVRFVCHLDLPKSIESYYQETGRAGRDGKDSNAWMIFGLQDVIKLSQMLETTQATKLYKQQARFKLDAMLTLCETIQCRRQYLLSYFGEDGVAECGNCDTCLNPAARVDASVDAQKLLSTIFRTGELFGAGYIIDVLRGSQSAKVIEREHNKLSCYGVGKAQDKNYWNTMIRKLLGLKCIQVKNWEYRNLGLTEKAGEILRGESLFEMRKVDPVAAVKGPKRRSDIDLSHGNFELFEELRQIRSNLAAKNKVPPYFIFPDKSLHDMCQLMPRNRDEFLMVNGVGASKCEKYGKLFMDGIARHVN